MACGEQEAALYAVSAGLLFSAAVSVALFLRVRSLSRVAAAAGKVTYQPTRVAPSPIRDDVTLSPKSPKSITTPRPTANGGAEGAAVIAALSGLPAPQEQLPPNGDEALLGAVALTVMDWSGLWDVADGGVAQEAIRILDTMLFETSRHAGTDLPAVGCLALFFADPTAAALWCCMTQNAALGLPYPSPALDPRGGLGEVPNPEPGSTRPLWRGPRLRQAVAWGGVRMRWSLGGDRVVDADGPAVEQAFGMLSLGDAGHVLVTSDTVRRLPPRVADFTVVPRHPRPPGVSPAAAAQDEMVYAVVPAGLAARLHAPPPQGAPPPGYCAEPDAEESGWMAPMEQSRGGGPVMIPTRFGNGRQSYYSQQSSLRGSAFPGGSGIWINAAIPPMVVPPRRGDPPPRDGGAAAAPMWRAGSVSVGFGHARGGLDASGVSGWGGAPSMYASVAGSRAPGPAPGPRRERASTTGSGLRAIGGGAADSVERPGSPQLRRGDRCAVVDAGDRPTSSPRAAGAAARQDLRVDTRGWDAVPTPIREDLQGNSQRIPSEQRPPASPSQKGSFKRAIASPSGQGSFKCARQSSEETPAIGVDRVSGIPMVPSLQLAKKQDGGLVLTGGSAVLAAHIVQKNLNNADDALSSQYSTPRVSVGCPSPRSPAGRLRSPVVSPRPGIGSPTGSRELQSGQQPAGRGRANPRAARQQPANPHASGPPAAPLAWAQPLPQHPRRRSETAPPAARPAGGDDAKDEAGVSVCVLDA